MNPIKVLLTYYFVVVHSFTIYRKRSIDNKYGNDSHLDRAIGGLLEKTNGL